MNRSAPRGGARGKRAAKTKGAAGKKGPKVPSSASERIDALIAGLGDWRGERLAEIRGIIREADPEVVEDWKWMGTPVWSHDGMCVLANAHKEKVKLQFFHGAHLPDPEGLFNAGLEGNKWRAIDLYEEDEIDRAALRGLILEAVAYNTTHTVPKSRGSRTIRAGAKPKLLSGGNPQIPKGDGDAPVQAYIAAMPGWKREAGRRLDDLVERAVPEVRKGVRWNSPFYGVEGKGWFLAFHCFDKYIKVTFFRGASLRPLPPVESKDENVRYFHLSERDELDERLLTRWIRQASKLPGWIP